MLLKSSWLEGKVPFSLLLLPLFWITLLFSPNLNQWKALWVLGITHVLLYASTNAYVNFYDGAKRYQENWPIRKKAPQLWLLLAIVLHILATVLGAWKVNITFATLVLLYGITSHTFGITRGQTKSTSYLVWGVIRAFQGIGGALIYYTGLNNFSVTQTPPKVILAGLVTSLLLAALYPVQGSTSAKRTTLVWLNVGLLLVAAVVSVWLFKTVISSQYTGGVIAAFTFGIVFILEKHNDNSTTKTRAAWRHWTGAIALNAYAFYLFTDHTQVFQLIY
jgi:hypothetical protein